MLTKLFVIPQFILASGLLFAQKTEPLVFEHNAEVIGAKYNEDDNLLISLSANGIVKLWAGQSAKVWEASTGKVIHALSGHKGKINGCEFSGNGKWIMTQSDEDGTVRLWDSGSGKLISSLQVRPNAGTQARLSSYGILISIFSHDTITVWNIASGKMLYVKPSSHPAIFSHDSRHLIVFNGNRATAYLAETGTPVMVEKKAIEKGARKVLKVD